MRRRERISISEAAILAVQKLVQRKSGAYEFQMFHTHGEGRYALIEVEGDDDLHEELKSYRHLGLLDD